MHTLGDRSAGPGTSQDCHSSWRVLEHFLLGDGAAAAAPMAAAPAQLIDMEPSFFTMYDAQQPGGDVSRALLRVSAIVQPRHTDSVASPLCLCAGCIHRHASLLARGQLQIYELSCSALARTCTRDRVGSGFQLAGTLQILSVYEGIGTLEGQESTAAARARTYSSGGRVMCCWETRWPGV